MKFKEEYDLKMAFLKIQSQKREVTLKDLATELNLNYSKLLGQLYVCNGLEICQKKRYSPTMVVKT